MCRVALARYVRVAATATVVAGRKGHWAGGAENWYNVDAPGANEETQIQLLLIRHGKAENRETFAAGGKPDEARPLTDGGRRKIDRAARGLSRLCPQINVLASSPLVRAVQTAEIIATAYGGLSIVQRQELAPEASPKALLHWLQARHEGTIALVGHEPALSTFVSWLLSGNQRSLLTLDKGGACLLEFAEKVAAATAVLRWCLESRQLRDLR